MVSKTVDFGICKHSVPCTLWIQTKMLMAGQTYRDACNTIFCLLTTVLASQAGQ